MEMPAAERTYNISDLIGQDPREESRRLAHAVETYHEKLADAVDAVLPRDEQKIHRLERLGKLLSQAVEDIQKQWPGNHQAKFLLDQVHARFSQKIENKRQALLQP